MPLSKLNLLSLTLLLASVLPFHNSQAQWTINDPFGGWNVTSSAVVGTKVFASTSNGNLYVTSNNGVSWVTVSGPTSQSVAALVAMGSSLFAGTTAGGVFRSDDNGATWTAINNGLSNTFVKSLFVVGTKVYVALDWCFLCSDGGVFVSADKGATWTAANSGIEKHPVSSFASIGGALFASSNGTGVFRSSDNGTSWVAVNSGINTTVSCLLSSGTTLYAGTSQGAFISNDNGNSWTGINNGLKDDYSSTLTINALTVSGIYLFAGTMDGLFLSTDNGNSWGILSPGNVAGRYLFINQGTVFASVVDFSIMSTRFYTQTLSTFPRIYSIKPAAATIGSKVTIKGGGFSTTASANRIEFSATFTSASTSTADSLTFIVPTGATTGPVSVQANGEYSSSVNLTIVPKINYVYPTSGPVGTMLTIAATGFSPNTSKDTVTLGGTLANISLVSLDGLNVNVPDGLQAGPTPLHLKVGGHTDPGTITFTVLPGITSFSPLSGAADTTVTINGTSFDPVPSNNTVTVGGVTATVTTATSTSLTIKVPTKAVTGLISVTVNGQTGSSSNKFTVLPKILSFNPSSGVTGTIVTIKGTGFDSTASKNQVAFAGVSATIKSATSTSLTAVVPTTASTGLISVTCGGNTAYSSKEFRVNPVIDSFSPASGYPGTLITVTGTGFNSRSSLAVNGTTGFTFSFTSQSISFFVPQTATTGLITITQDSATATSATKFTVLHVSAPVAIPPTNITTDGFTALWNSVKEANFYLLDISSDNFTSYVVGFKGKILSDTFAIASGLKTGTGYQYRIRAVNGAGISSVYSNIISSVYTGDINVMAQKTIYPNPASNTIFLASDESGIVTVRVIDTSGKYYDLNFHQSGNLAEIDISNLPSGLYILQVIEGNKTKAFKFMKL